MTIYCIYHKNVCLTAVKCICMHSVTVPLPGLVQGSHDFCSGVLYLTTPMKHVQGISNTLWKWMTILYLSQLSSIRMQGLLLLIFVKHDHLPFIRDVRTNYTRTGLYGYWVKKYSVFNFAGYLCLWCFMPLNGLVVWTWCAAQTIIFLQFITDIQQLM